jgi:hypothetical protein
VLQFQFVHLPGAHQGNQHMLTFGFPTRFKGLPQTCHFYGLGAIIFAMIFDAVFKFAPHSAAAGTLSMRRHKETIRFFFIVIGAEFSYASAR